MFRRHVVLIAPALAVLASLSACSEDPDASSETSYSVEAGDKTCAIEKDTIAAGEVTLAIENTGTKVTEVYVYAKDGDSFSKVVEEAEDITAGSTKNLTVDLDAGDYQITCKPGMVGDGISTGLTVTE